MRSPPPRAQEVQCQKNARSWEGDCLECLSLTNNFFSLQNEGLQIVQKWPCNHFRLMRSNNCFSKNIVDVYLPHT